MKLTERKLRKLIREEARNVIYEKYNSKQEARELLMWIKDFARNENGLFYKEGFAEPETFEVWVNYEKNPRKGARIFVEFWGEKVDVEIDYNREKVYSYSGYYSDRIEEQIKDGIVDMFIDPTGSKLFRV